MCLCHSSSPKPLHGLFVPTSLSARHSDTGLQKGGMAVGRLQPTSQVTFYHSIPRKTLVSSPPALMKSITISTFIAVLTAVASASPALEARIPCADCECPDGNCESIYFFFLKKRPGKETDATNQSHPQPRLQQGAARTGMHHRPERLRPPAAARARARGAHLVCGLRVPRWYL
jgi:hypothetical protein